MGILNENQIMGASAAGGDYEIEQSLRFNKPDSAYLSHTPSGATNQKTWTWSGWVKKCGALNSGVFDARQTSSGQFTQLNFNNLDVLQFYTSMSGVDYSWESVPLYRDPSAWYHIVAVLNTPSSTQQDRFIIYINGVRQSNGNQYGALDLNVTTWINSANPHSIGRTSDAGHYFDGYMGEVNFIDGQALTPDSFGETGDYGEWKPIKYAGTYGTNGFYLKFENASSLGNDSAGSNNWTPSNLAATDQMLDSPTNNFATLNPLDEGGTNTVAEGNLQYDKTGANFGPMRGTLGVTTGKWYFEAMRSSNTNICQVGVSNNYDISQNGGDNSMGSAGGIGAAWDSRGIYYRTGGSDLGKNTFATNEIVSIAFDADTGKIWWRKSGGSWQDSGNPETGANPSFTASGYSELMPFVNGEGGGGLVANFGQDSSFAGNKTPQGNQDANSVGDFFYPVPSGFLSLCTKSLPDVDVIPSEHFNPVLWTGNGTDGRDITNIGFTPDFVWIKSRSLGSSHLLNDTVRGANKSLFSEGTYAETPNNGGGYLDAFVTDGFSVTSGGSGDAAVNDNGATYVAWNWKAGGSASSNSNGTITSSVSANAAAGFSIVSYTGNATNAATVGHGLSVSPEMVIVKNRDRTSNWHVGGDGVGTVNQYLNLNTTSAIDSASTGFQGFTSTVFQLGTDTDWNANSEDLIAYAFHSVDGYSKVGSYTGNGNADGPFVFCGFRPAFVLIKNINVTQNWQIFDNKRDAYNAVGRYIIPNTSAAEGGANGLPIDFLSNGFKPRHSGSYINNNTLIYIAFAESPFKHSNAR